MGAHDASKRSITAEALARYLKTSIRTARRIWAEPRADYERRGMARSAPWETEGISRATWYRRRAQKNGSASHGDASIAATAGDGKCTSLGTVGTSD